MGDDDDDEEDSTDAEVVEEVEAVDANAVPWLVLESRTRRANNITMLGRVLLRGGGWQWSAIAMVELEGHAYAFVAAVMI